MLSENILKTYSNRYGFDRIEMKYENLAYDCVAEIYVKLRYFDPSKGTKAFSYFGTLVKNYLILASMKVSNKGKKKSNIEDFVNIEMENNFNFYEEDNADCVIAKEEGDQKAKVHMEDLRAILIDNEFTDIETDVINTFLVLYENCDNLDFYNKKYIYVLMNEMSNIDKKHFYPALKKFLLEYNKYYGEPL